MRFVSIIDTQPGMYLDQEIQDAYGRVLIAGGTYLTQQYIDKLIELGIPGIYIDDELSKGIEIVSPIPYTLKMKAEAAVRNGDIDDCKNISKLIVEEILKRGYVSFDMTDMRTFDDYTMAHSVNVAVLACTVGFGLRLKDNDLEELVLSALLHDLGKLSIPLDILNKPTRLTKEEFALVKTHVVASFEMLQNRLDISSVVKNAVLLHHENQDGSGYPLGKAGDEIAYNARILHVCDVYDALTSKRPYKEPYSPFVALNIIEKGKGTQFDPYIVDEFVKHVPLFPKGTIVELNDGRRAIIVENKGDMNKAPLIRIEGTFEEIDLRQSNDIEISIPGDADPETILHEEKSREDMVSKFEKKKVMVLDEIGSTFFNLKDKLGYLYNFQQIKTDALGQGYIRKYGLPDIMIVDIDGRNLYDFEDMKSKNISISEKIPVLVVGSYSDVETISKFRKLGITNYILKPFRLSYIQSEMARVVQ